MPVATADSLPERLRSKFQVRPLQPFGVEIEGDLSRPLSANDRALIVSLVDTHGIVLARRQTLTIQQQRAVMEPLGRVETHDLEYVTGDDGVLNADVMGFHSDFAFAHTPYKNLSLHAVDVVDGATVTRFANGALAYQRLSPERRRLLRFLTTTAVSADHRRRTIGYDLPSDAPQFVRAAVIYHHRTSQPILYVNEMQHARFNELGRADSDALLEEMFSLLYRPEAVLEHVWSAGDLLIWDNLALQHGRPGFPETMTRRLQRASVADVGGEEMISGFVNTRPIADDPCGEN